MAGEGRHCSANGYGYGVLAFLGGASGGAQRHNIVEYIRGERHEDQSWGLWAVQAISVSRNVVVYVRVCLDRPARDARVLGPGLPPVVPVDGQE